MRQFFAIAALPLIVPAASTARTLVVHSPQKPAELAQSNDNCPRTTSVYAWDRGKQVTPRRLTDLPDANVYASVLRHIGRCEVPVVVRE